MCKTLTLIGLLMACVATVALGDTVAYWRFDDFGIDEVDNPAGSVMSGNALPDSSGRTVWRVAAYDHSGNGNHLTSWEYAWAGHTWSGDVPTTLVTSLGLDNTLSGQTAGDSPSMMTWSAQSQPSGIDLETWSPVEWTIEASFKVNNVDGYNTIVGRDGRDVCTTNLNGDAEPALAPFYLSIRQGDGSLGVLFTDVSGHLYMAQSDPGTIEVGQWYNATAVCDGTSLALYINNALITTTDMTASGSPDTAMAIGHGSGGDWSPGTWSVTRGLYDGVHVDRVSGWVDEIRFSDVALKPSQFLYGRVSGKATSPKPVNNESDVYYDPVLSWNMGAYDATHTLYFGDDRAAVENSTTPLVQGLTDTSYDIGRLEFGKTYYWRVDEVNTSPDRAVFQGSLWSFTVEPHSIQISGSEIIVTASSQSTEFSPPENTVNGSGLGEDNTHSFRTEDMWFTKMPDSDPWIQFEFETVKKLDTMKVWNSNSAAEGFMGYGVKGVLIESSTDGVTWDVSEDVNEFSRATGAPNYNQYDEIALGGIVAKKIRLKIQSNFGGFMKSYSLSEVQFTMIPTTARLPEPGSGAVNIHPHEIVSWRAGRDVVESTVYVSPDPNEVADGLAASVSSTTHTADLTDFDIQLGETYYWRVDEVNNAEAMPVWPGSMWSLSTVESLLIDDFESYTNSTPNRPFQTWLDGYGYSADEFYPVAYGGNGTGSAVGHDIWSANSSHYEGSIMEVEAAALGSGQSMPIYYSGNSRVDCTFSPSQDWAMGGIKTLVLFVKGNPGNVAGALYVEINGTRIHHSDSGVLGKHPWIQWPIDLSSTGIALSQVTSLSIGVDSSGSGMILVDEIRLYKDAPVTVVAIDPGSNGLAAKFSLDDNLDDTSGNGLGFGTATGFIGYVDGMAGNGKALSLNGLDNYVEVPVGGVIESTDSITISCWADFSNEGGNWQRLWDFGSGEGANPYLFLSPRAGATGPIRFAIRSATVDESWIESASTLSSGWQHVTAVVDGETRVMRLYINGDLVSEGNTEVVPSDLGNTVQNYLGKSQWPDALYQGSIDEVMIYTRALSHGEVRYLAGDQ